MDSHQPGPHWPEAPEGTPPRSRWERLWRRRGPWLVLTAGMIAFVTVLTLTQPLPRIDRMLQDNARAAMSQQPTDDIVIVAIDEKSLAAIGRWPWRRALHAELLRRIAEQSPRCIGLDLLLPEQDAAHPGDDVVLAEAMADAGCVVLPLALQSIGPLQQELAPLPLLARQAAAIGHAHLSIDQDGIARSIYLREGFAGRTWPHFALALQEAGQAYAHGGPAPAQPSLPPPANPPQPWQRGDHLLIVFTQPGQSFRTVSYIDVLRGQVPADLFRDRHVLVGATAPGMGDIYAAAAPSTTGLTPGVTIFANVLQGLLSDHRVVVASPRQDLAFNVLPLTVALLGLLWLRPLGVLALIAAMLALRLGLHVARPWVGVQFAPASGFAGLLLIYPMWSLMRLTATLRFLRTGTTQLMADLKGFPPPRLPPPRGDFLDRQMAVTAAAAMHMRDLHRFVRDGLNHLPDATMVLDPDGRVRMANFAALRHWRAGQEELAGRDAHALLADVRRRDSSAPMMPPGALREGLAPIVGEGEDAQGRILLMRCVPFFDTGNAHAGWLIALVDVTQMRRTQSQRDEALRFISHDIREPSASILTTVELARTRPELFSRETLLDRIERHAQTGLELADGFVNVARAEAQPFRAEMLDLVDLVQQTVDDAWAAARRRQVQVVITPGPEEAPCMADRALLMRALANVLSNALKYSPRGGEVRCRVTERLRHWVVAVQDDGPGIAPELQSQLFQPFHRLHRETHPDVHGVGLGLLLVRTAVQRHGGSVEIDSAADAGCTVMLVLPKPTQAELDALATDKE